MPVGVVGRDRPDVGHRAVAQHDVGLPFDGSTGGLRRDPLDGARVVAVVAAAAVAGALGSVIEVAIEVLPTHHGLIVSRPANRPAEDATLASWSSPRSSAAAAWSVATTPTGPCPARSSSTASTTLSAPRAPASARAGTSSSSRAARSARRSGAATTAPDAPDDPWLSGIRAAPVLVLCLSHKDAYLDRYAAPDKGWTDRDEERWPVPYWHVDTGMAALLDPAHGDRRGPRQPLLRGAPGAPRRRARRPSRSPPAAASSGVVSIGYAVPGPRSPSLRRHRRTGHEVAHWGRFGVAGEGAR